MQVQWPADRCHPAMPALVSSAPATAHPTHPAALWFTSLVCAMTVLDANVVGIVLPALSRALARSATELEWMVSAYALCFAALLLPAGRLADRLGRRRVLLAGLAGFGAASMVCGLAPSAPALIAARALQGAGAALMLAPALALVGHQAPQEPARSQAWAFWGTVMGLTMVAAPLLGGAVAQWLGWRWAFFLNLPLCAGLALGVRRCVAESREPDAGPLDRPGVLLFSAAMFGLTWALIQGASHGWTSPQVLLRLGAGLALMALFIAVERRRAHPLLDVGLFRAPALLGAVLAMFAYAATAQVMTALLPLFLQSARGHGALAAGLAMLPFSLAMLVFPRVARALHQRPGLSNLQLLVLGLAAVALGNAVLAWAAPGRSGGLLGLGMALLGAGGGLMNGETQRAIMGQLPPQRAGMASGISTTARFSGVLLGFSALGSQSHALGFGAAFGLAAMAAAAAALLVPILSRAGARRC